MSPSEILNWMWGAGYMITWLAGTWICAYVLRYTAPVTCPMGKSDQECHHSHAIHIDRQNAWWCVAMGVVWPIWILYGFAWLFTRSVEGAANNTPVPKFKVPVTDKQLEAADQELDEFGKELEERRTEHLNRHHEEKRRIYEGTVWTPPTEPESDPAQHSR